MQIVSETAYYSVVSIHTKEYDIIQLVKNDNIAKNLQQHVTPNPTLIRQTMQMLIKPTNVDLEPIVFVDRKTIWWKTIDLENQR